MLRTDMRAATADAASKAEAAGEGRRRPFANEAAAASAYAAMIAARPAASSVSKAGLISRMYPP